MNPAPDADPATHRRPGDDRPAPPLPPGGGLLLVDKPSGCTSHDVVGRLRKVLRTRRIGHAGTLDPMATGLLVVAVDRSTKLLGHLALTDKAYTATIRLGQRTDSDDADGTIVEMADPAAVRALAVTELRAGMAALTGPILQVPSSVSAIKIAGRRAYDIVRSGGQVELAPRPVTVGRFELVGEPRTADGVLDIDVEVDCTTGTYVRSLARDLGDALGVGGHLIRLRRTRVGPFLVTDAVNIFPAEGADRGAQVAEEFARAVAARILLPADAVRAAFPARVVTDAEVTELRYGRSVPPGGITGTYGAFDGTGRLIALLADGAEVARPVLGWLTA
jgi:tRNA pseudouridine55 synthase